MKASSRRLSESSRNPPPKLREGGEPGHRGHFSLIPSKDGRMLSWQLRFLQLEDKLDVNLPIPQEMKQVLL